MSMSIKRCVFAASACTSSNSWSRRDLNSCIIVFTALIVSRVLYAFPAVSFLSSDLLNKIDSMLPKAHKFGYTTEVLKVTDMLQNADNKLFSLMFRSSHCLHTLLPDLKWLTLSCATLELASICLTAVINCTYKQSFVNRCLFRDCYWHVFLCGTYMLFDLIWFIIFLHIIGWRLSVSINDMLCYVRPMLSDTQFAAGAYFSPG